MKKFKLTYLLINSFITVLAAAVFLCRFNPAYAQSYASGSCQGDCTAYKTGSKIARECPDGTKKRNDISPECLRKLNSGNNCLNTMPVDGVDRVPEDVCYRNQGWKNKRNHEGMDYASNKGSAVYAAADGTVIEANPCSKGYGRKIIIRHKNANPTPKDNLVELPDDQYYTTTYAHLSKIVANVGAFVHKGDLIGEVGGSSCSGLEGGIPDEDAYGNHLHFEIRTGSSGRGDVIDPMCDDIQSLCGQCNKDFSPSQCRDKPIGFGQYNFTHTRTTSPSVTNPEPVGFNYKNSVTAGTDCSITSYRNSFTSCIFCDIFRIIFDVASTMAKNAYDVLAGSVINVVIIAMALWLAFTIIKFNASFEAKEPRILIKTILNQAFIVVIVVTILRFDLDTFLNLALEPVFNTGMKIAQYATSGQMSGNCSGITQVQDLQGGLPASMGNNILCTINTIQGQILDIMSIGSTSLCVAFKVEAYIPYILPHFGYLIVGIILWLSSFLLMVIYPFLLIDAVLQLSIAAALIPVAIGGYAFKVTRGYAGKVWETFMNAMFTFLFLSIIIYIITTGITDIMNDVMTQELRNAGTNSNAFEVILDSISWWSVNFLKLVFFMLLGWAVLGEAKKFAGKFSKGGFSSGGVAQPVGSLAMQGATRVGQLTGKAAWSAAKGGGSAIVNAGKERINTMRNNRMANKIRNNKNTVTDENGNMVLTSKNWRGQTVTRMLSTDAAGNNIVTKSVGRRSKSNDKFMSVERRYDKNGNLIQEKTGMNAAACKNMLGKDGHVNEVARYALMHNSSHHIDDINKAMMSQILKERMPNFSDADMDKEFESRNIISSSENEFIMEQVNKDGSKTTFTMKTVGDRVLTEVEKIDKSGQARKYSSDGIFNKTSKYRYADGKIVENSVKNKYAFADYYTKYDSCPMDSNGVFATGFPGGETLFSDSDLAEMKEQIAVYGKPESLNMFSR